MTDIKVWVPEFEGAQNYDWQDRLHETYKTKVVDAYEMRRLLGPYNFLNVANAIEDRNIYLRYLANGRESKDYSIHIAQGTKKEFSMLAEDALIQLQKWFEVPVDQPDYFGEDADKLLIWIAVLLQIQRLDLLGELWDSIQVNAGHPHNTKDSHVYQLLRYWLDEFDPAQLEGGVIP